MKYFPEAFLDECLFKIYKWRVKMNFKKLILKVMRVIILTI